MSVEFYFLEWTCDICGKKAMKKGYGLPPDYIWFIPLEGITAHACGSCAEKHGLKHGKPNRDLRLSNVAIDTKKSFGTAWPVSTGIL